MAKLFWLTCFTALTDYSYLCLKLTALHDAAPTADLREKLIPKIHSKSSASSDFTGKKDCLKESRNRI